LLIVYTNPNWECLLLINILLMWGDHTITLRLTLDNNYVVCTVT